MAGGGPDSTFAAGQSHDRDWLPAWRRAGAACKTRGGRGGDAMVRAAIVGIGRWGQTLVRAMQGQSGTFRFTAGHTRTRVKAEGFCAEHGIALRDNLGEILA